MKLIIDISEQMYQNAKAGVLCGNDILVKAIKNGIPHENVTEFADRCRECGGEKVLDKIRERVKLEKLGYPPSAGYYRAIMKVLQIIDKYKAESGDKDD